MKKKRFALVFIILILVLSFSACGGGEQQTTDSDSKGSVNDKTEKVSFEELTVVDNEQCIVKITDIDPDNIWGYTLKAYIENKSTDKTYTYSVTNASINGVQTEAGFSAEVTEGKKSNEEISFSDDELSSYGIDSITDIELTFEVYDYNDWTAEPVAKETIHVYPYGKDEAIEFVREPQATDIVVVDNEEVSVIITDYEEDGFWGYTINLYLINKTDKELMYSVDEASINGFMADPFWAKSVGAGNVAFSSMSWSDSDLEDNGIIEVEEIEMKFTIYDSDDWSADTVFDDIVILKI